MGGSGWVWVGVVVGWVINGYNPYLTRSTGLIMDGLYSGRVWPMTRPTFFFSLLLLVNVFNPLAYGQTTLML